MHLISCVWLRLCGADFALAHQVGSHVASGLGFCEYVVGLIFSVFPRVFGSGHSCYICLHWCVCVCVGTPLTIGGGLRTFLHGMR